MEATLAALAAPQELAAAAAPRMPAHTLRILAQVASHDPLLLMALGTTKEARARAMRPAPASLAASPGAHHAVPSGRADAPLPVQPVLLSAPSFAPVTTQLAAKQPVLSSFCHPPTRTPQASAAQAAGTALAETGGFLRAADTSVRQRTTGEMEGCCAGGGRGPRAPGAC